MLGEFLPYLEGQKVKFFSHSQKEWRENIIAKAFASSVSLKEAHKMLTLLSKHHSSAPLDSMSSKVHLKKNHVSKEERRIFHLQNLSTLLVIVWIVQKMERPSCLKVLSFSKSHESSSHNLSIIIQFWQGLIICALVSVCLRAFNRDC